MLVLIVVSVFLAVGLNPLVEWLMRRGVRRGLAVATVFVLVIVVFIGFVAAVVPPVAQQTAELVQSVPESLDKLRQNDSVARLDDDYQILSKIQDYITSGNLGGQLFGGILGVGKYVLSAVFGAVTVLILTLYLLTSLPSIKRQAYRLAPSSRRERVQLLGDEILARVGGYVAGALGIATVAGLSSFVFLEVISLQYAVALALVVALLDLVPMIGATIGAVVVSVAALADSSTKAIACVVFYLVYQQVENYLIYPRVMKRAVDVPPALTVVAALLGGALLGVVGALLAIPTAAAVLLIVREVVIPRQDSS